MAEKSRAFVVGFPIQHSLSPYIHRFWLERYEIYGSYEACEVASDDFPDFINILKSGKFIGGNVTLPHKEQAFKLAEKCDDIARDIGAANSLWIEDGTLCASNSDSYGFTRNLDDYAAGWRNGQTALVLGAGGAARAVVVALKMSGFNSILLGNRTRVRAEQLSSHFGSIVKVVNWQDIHHHIGRVDLIVNTTSIGLRGNEGLFPVDFRYARKDAIVNDIVYIPLITPFLQMAAENGLKVVDGLGMLLHQAVFGFERWFGIRPVVDGALRAQIMRKLI